MPHWLTIYAAPWFAGTLCLILLTFVSLHIAHWPQAFFWAGSLVLAPWTGLVFALIGKAVLSDQTVTRVAPMLWAQVTLVILVINMALTGVTYGYGLGQEALTRDLPNYGGSDPEPVFLVVWYAWYWFALILKLALVAASYAMIPVTIALGRIDTTSAWKITQVHFRQFFMLAATLTLAYLGLERFYSEAMLSAGFDWQGGSGAMNLRDALIGGFKMHLSWLPMAFIGEIVPAITVALIYKNLPSTTKSN